MDKQRPKVSANIFVIRDNKLLLGKRKNSAGDGFWGLPGGHIEYMESLTEGAQRELKEETGLIADLIFRGVVSNPLKDDGTHYVHINFLAQNVIGEPELTEPNKCYGWEWFHLDNLPDDIFIGHKKDIPAFLNNEIFVD